MFDKIKMVPEQKVGIWPLLGDNLESRAKQVPVPKGACLDRMGLKWVSKRVPTRKTFSQLSSDYTGIPYVMVRIQRLYAMRMQ